MLTVEQIALGRGVERIAELTAEVETLAGEALDRGIARDQARLAHRRASERADRMEAERDLAVARVEAGESLIADVHEAAQDEARRRWNPPSARWIALYAGTYEMSEIEAEMMNTSHRDGFIAGAEWLAQTQSDPDGVKLSPGGRSVDEECK